MNGRSFSTLRGSVTTLLMAIGAYACIHFPAPTPTTYPLYGIPQALALEIGGGIDTDIEEQVEDSVEHQIEDSIEQLVEDAVENQLDDSVEELVESTVENQVEGSVEQLVEGAVENQIEGSVEQLVEGTVENQIEGSVEQLVEGAVENQIEGSVENLVEGAIENRLEGFVENEVEDSLGNQIEKALNQDAGGLAGGSGNMAVGTSPTPDTGVERNKTKSTQSTDDLVEIALDKKGNRIYTKQWFILTDEDSIAALEKKGYLFTKKTKLQGLGHILAVVTAPDSYDITEARSATVEVVDRSAVSIDFNHIYEAEAAPRVSPDTLDGIYPNEVMQLPAISVERDTKLGIIDTQVNKEHETLKKVDITSKRFALDQYPAPADHGTAVASIISGHSEHYSGLLPRTPLYVASVFFNHPKEGRIATTIGLIRALDWLVLSGVEVINMSLAGPANTLLEAALARAGSKGVIVVAAVGNSGPASTPLYPAGYDSVVAVTAVSKNHSVYRRAVRGAHVDLSAPGVGIVHADSNGRLTVSSGTSLAAPFVAAVIYRAKIDWQVDAKVVLQSVYTSAIDLGEEGYDPIFGNGLIQFTHNRHSPRSLVKN